MQMWKEGTDVKKGIICYKENPKHEQIGMNLN